MAQWEVRVVYRNGDRHWENIWGVDVGALEDVPADLILAFESFAIATLLNRYSVERIVRRPAGSHDAFIEVLVGTAGALLVADNKVLPLFNVVRLLLNAGAGRPGLKLLRGVLLDVHILDEENHIDPALLAIVEGAAITLFNAASDAACSLTVGDSFRAAVSPVVDSTIEMRQLHRKRRRTT